MFGFPVFVGVCFFSAVFLWSLYYSPVVGLSPPVGRLRWERSDRIWGAIWRSCMVSFRVKVYRDNIYAILRTSIVFYSVFWFLCSFFFAPPLDAVSLTLLFFFTQLASVQNFSLVSSFESLKVYIGTGLSCRWQIIYLSHHQPISIENFPSTTLRMQLRIGEMQVQSFIFSMPRRLSAFYNLCYPLYVRSVLFPFPVHLSIFPMYFSPHCWVATNFRRRLHPINCVVLPNSSGMTENADSTYIMSCRCIRGGPSNHQLVCQFLQRAAALQFMDRSPAVHWPPMVIR